MSGPTRLLRLSFLRIDPADAPASNAWTRRQEQALERYERRCRRVARRKTKRRPTEAQFRIRVGRKERSREIIDRRDELLCTRSRSVVMGCGTASSVVLAVTA